MLTGSHLRLFALSDRLRAELGQPPEKPPALVAGVPLFHVSGLMHCLLLVLNQRGA